MPQSFAAVNLHLIFSTKSRVPSLVPGFAQQVHDYIGGTLREHNCKSIRIGGVEDHVHILFSLSRTVSIAEIVRIVKTSSSRWIHETVPQHREFAWQSGYGVFSVSQSGIEAVREYIDKQVEHHRTVTFQEEYRKFLSVHGIEWDELYIWD